MLTADEVSPALAHFNKIEGMMGVPSADIWDALLDRQERAGVSGDLFESGTYKGRSAIILAHHLRDYENYSEHLHLFDIHPYLLVDEFRQFEGHYSLHIGGSEDARTLMNNFAALAGRMRFFHSDASHTFMNVEKDLLLAAELLSDDGIVAVDDYCNPLYPQVAAAVCYALFLHKLDFSPFLIADNKIYLSRSKCQTAMRLFVRDELFPKIRSKHALRIGKTDLDERFDLYTFTDKERPDDEDVYGSAIYGPIVARD